MPLLLKLLALAAAATAQTCDQSCRTCATTTHIAAVPCNASSAAQRGWALSPPGPNQLRTITFKSDLVSGCAGWDRNTGAMEVKPCVSQDGASWTNASARACQQWVHSPSSTGGFDTIAASAGCVNNEGNPDGCLDVHSKLGPGFELTRCYAQPNDNFSVGLEGLWMSQDAPPTFPQRCMAVSGPELCPYAGCCTACAHGRHFNSDGFCVLGAPPPPPSRKVYIWLAVDNNSTGDDAAIETLSAHTEAFTGVVFQFYAICGKGAAPNTCKNADMDGPARLLPMWSEGSSPPADLAARLRSKLGEDKDMIAAISFGGSQDPDLLVSLFRDANATAAFIEDAITAAKAQNLAGFTFDLEPYGTGADGWFEDAAVFFEKFTKAMRAEGLTTGWDSNGPEGVSLDVDTWMDMPTYYGPGNGFKVALVEGVYAVGSTRYAYGLCPTCQILNESQVEERFAELRKEGGPGALVSKMQLFSLYGAGQHPPDGWQHYWSRMEAWLKG